MRKQDIPFWNPLLTYDEQDEDVKQFWQEEAKKLEKGITINGVFFHPWLYWHLNFWKMMIDDGDRRIPGNSHLRDNEWFFAEILKRAEEENKGIFMFGTRRFGKALLNSELLYTPTGEIKIGDALVGQKIYGEDGKLEEITGVYPQGAVRTYRILFEDGRNAICCGEHLWRVYSQGAWRVLSTNAIIKKNWKDMYIQTCKAVDYPQAKLPINPNTFGSMVASYLLGTTDSIYLTKQQCKKYVRSSVAQKKIFIESLIKGFKNVVTGEELLDINRIDPDVIGFVLRMFWSYGWYASYNQTTMEIFVSERIDQVAIKDIKVYGKYNATCITVDRPEGLFLTTNYLVTHNSAIMSSFLARNATMTYNLGHNVIGSSKEDLASIAEYLEFGLDNVHPFLKINRTGNNWEKEVIMGNRMITGERDVHARIKIINVEGTSKGGSSLKTAGSTPYTSIYDEVGKYPFLGAYLAGRPSHMMHGKMRGMILSAGCVCVGTKIYRGDGSVAFIEDIKLGDTVVGYKGKGDECSIERVDWVKPPSEKPCYRINFDTGDKLECSYDHPIYVYKDGNFTFVDAMYLEPGDVSLAVSIKKDSTKMYTAVVRYIEYMGYKMVYNMTTSGSHTYLANNIVTHNTGGNVERSQDAQKVMNDPAKYHFIIMDYDLLNKHTVNPTWRICKSGCFVPGQMSHAYEKKKITLAEYLDKPKSTLLKKIPIEVTDFDKNTKVIRDRLNELANGDRELYIQEKMAYPLTIDDCFLNTNVNRFPIEDAAKHKNELLENGRVGKVVDVYKLAGNKMGQNYSDKPVAPYPFKGGNIDCPVVIYEDPPEDGGVFDFTYCSAIDPFKQEKADTDSLGAFYVFKRAVGINDPYGNRIVASYAARPASSDDFCRTCETLIEAYGAKCLMENADRIFELYLARQGKDQYLLEDGEALANRIIRPGARQNNRLGLAPTPINQRMLFSAVLQYCWEEVVVDVDQFGNEITQLGIYRIDDVELLEEIIAFGHGVNTDRIIAFGHALLLARYYDDMNYMPESSTAKKNAQIRDMLKCRQAIGFASNPANKGFASRSFILNR